MTSEVSEELGEVIVDKETARASYVPRYLLIHTDAVLNLLTHSLPLLTLLTIEFTALNRLQCFDTVDWATGRASVL